MVVSLVVELLVHTFKSMQIAPHKNVRILWIASLDLGEHGPLVLPNAMGTKHALAKSKLKHPWVANPA